MTLSVGLQGPSLPTLLSGGWVLIYHLQRVAWTGQGSRKEAECRRREPPCLSTDSQLLSSAQSGSSQQDPPQEEA